MRDILYEVRGQKVKWESNTIQHKHTRGFEVMSVDRKSLHCRGMNILWRSNRYMHQI